MDAPRTGKNESLSAVASSGASRTSFAKTGGRRGGAENGSDDAAGFHEVQWQKRVVDAGGLGDGAGCRGSAESDQRMALSGRHKTARCGIPSEGIRRISGR